MKTITLEKLKERGLKQGDLYYLEHEFEDYTGWYLVIAEGLSISLNTKNQTVCGRGSKTLMVSLGYKINKIIMTEDLPRNFTGDTSRFFRTFNETLVKKVITNVIESVIEKKIAKYISAVHFGGTNTYTWRVPKQLEKIEFKIGDIVKVDTKYGGQYVEVRDVMEDEYDKNYKEVLAIIKKC